MKISLNIIRQYLDFELPPTDQLLEKIGAQLGAVDQVEDLTKKYQGIIIAKVIDCQKIANTEHLNLCKIDDGQAAKDIQRDEQGHVQVVCGAPNVRAGMMVAWLPPGTTVPSSYKTDAPLILTAREIQGQTSHGMLASPKELALGDSHEGLLELDVITISHRVKQGEVSPVEALHNYIEEPNIKPGDDFAKAYQLDDHIIEIENKMFTHRPDCFGQLGIAREIAGILDKPFKSPSIYKLPKTGTSENSDLTVNNEVPDLVPRFIAQVFDNLTVGPSPVWLQTYLHRLDVRPINNVVDATNYFMLLTGQPLHAYDYDKVKQLSSGDKAVIVVRNPKPNEKIKLLSGKEVEPQADAIVIATDKKLIGLGGVMGGSETEVDDNTKRIILECANFDMNSVRRTSMINGLFTDAVTRFTKGQRPLQNDCVICWTSGQIVCDSNATPGYMIDINSAPYHPQ